MAAETLGRSAVLAYRARAHDLEQPAPDPARCGVLEVGVQDTPPGTAAGRALTVRLAPPQPPDPAQLRGLALVHSLRGAMHVHRVRDLALLTAALRPDEESEAGELDEVAAAMTRVMADDRTRTKGELSTQLTQVLPPRLRPWCTGCQVQHVPDGLFRSATLPAGLRLTPAGNRSAVFGRSSPPEPSAPQAARRELLRRYLRRCGAATPKDLAAWAGVQPPVAKKWWSLLADELVEVRIEGRRFWLHAEDLAAARTAPEPTAVRLLPPYDPLVEVAHRELLLPDPAQRRQVWRAVANPGVLLIAGELPGTWRVRAKVLTVAPFRPLSAVERRGVRIRASGDARAVVDVVFAD